MNPVTNYGKPRQAAAALDHISRILKAEKPLDDVTLEYVRMGDPRKEFTDYEIDRFHLLFGDEYVLIRIREKYDGEYHLIYVINVSALSVLALAAETMDLISRKF